MRKCTHKGAVIVGGGLFMNRTVWWYTECGATKFTYAILQRKSPRLTRWRLPKREIQRNKEDGAQ